MKSSEIREKFLRYFEERGHRRFKSDSLLPSRDPTLLFTSAGMVQFKNYFLGLETIPEKKACSSQKCFRTSDIENIGLTARHHTFFEMLGNFSFGDYFKKEAIAWAWEFLKKEMGLDVSKMYASVYKEDSEAFELWKKFLPESKIIRLGEDSNFWNMGPTGPCGPCSEILFDTGEKYGCGKSSCAPGCDCDRYLEVWNLVFTEFNRAPDGSLKSLPSKNIDTGMGLERLARAVQGAATNYDTDLFRPLTERFSELSGISYGENPVQDVSIRLICDHIKAASFLISDGILPSNIGRGYILRRILRRALANEKKIGLKKSTLEKLIPEISKIYGPAYPELNENNSTVLKMLHYETGKFFDNIDRALEYATDEIIKTKKNGLRKLSADSVFRLYDTYGFPVDLLKDLAEENGMEFDSGGFEKLLEEYKDRSRATWQGKGDTSIVKNIITAEGRSIGETKFAGYEKTSGPAEIKAIIKDGLLKDSLNEGEEGIIILDRTPFYPEQGGQVGDTGSITSDTGGLAEISDTGREASVILHYAQMKKGALKKGEKVLAAIDSERRDDIRRNHTATHLLQAALRKYFGKDITQSGSYVAPDRFRFDFTFYSKFSPDDLRKIETEVNKRIIENHPVSVSEMQLEEAKKTGAMALFSEKYSGTVRVVTISSDKESPVSIELCGGTHTVFTGEIGLFKIISVSSVSANNRRIEGITGRGALLYLHNLEDLLAETAGLLKAPAERENITNSLKKLIEEKKQLKAEAEKCRKMLLSGGSADRNDKEEIISGIKFIFYTGRGLEHRDLRAVGDEYKKKNKGVFVLTGEVEGKKNITVMVTKDTVSEKAAAGKLVKYLAGKFGGTGGGNPELAQGVIPSTLPADKFIQALIKELGEYLK